MTDEEIAEEYCNEEVPFDTTESGEKLYTENDLKQAFLAGLKAGRCQKWHKVADGDLPKDIGSVLVNRGGSRTYKASYNGKWYEYYDGDEIDDVVAWCEMPEYKEE